MTLVHSGPRLLPLLNAKLAGKVQAYLQKLGCKFVFNEKATEVEGGLVTASGAQVHAKHRIGAGNLYLVLYDW